MVNIFSIQIYFCAFFSWCDPCGSRSCWLL